jgi:hypothetical protein
MVATTSIVAGSKRFSHKDAHEVSQLALRNDLGHTVVVHLNEVEDATTAAFAELVLLRRALLSQGRDLRLAGLRKRAACIYEVNRLGSVLPLQ